MTTVKKSLSSTSSRPDDKPFDFNLDAVKAEIDLTPFVIQYGGKRWSFQHMRELDTWELVKAGAGDAQSVLSVFKAALGSQFEDFSALKLPAWKMDKLFEAYEEYCGVQPWEQEGSTDS